MRHAPYGLRGTTLEVYAALYDLTRKEEKVYSRAWLCGWLEMPTSSVSKALRDLEKRGLLSVSEDSRGVYALQALELLKISKSSAKNEQSSAKNEQSSAKNEQTHLIYGDTNVSLIRKQIKNTGERATRDASPREAEKIPPSRAEEEDLRFKIQDSAPLPLQVTRGRAARVPGEANGVRHKLRSLYGLRLLNSTAAPAKLDCRRRKTTPNSCICPFFLLLLYRKTNNHSR